MIILAIETSCDETAASVFDSDIANKKMKEQSPVLSNVLFSQVKLQKEFGGVVPEVASRSHLDKIDSIIKEALNKSKKTLEDIDVVAVTSKPGLPGSLLIGVNTAKAIAYALNKKLIGINHLEGHAFSSFLSDPNIPFPHLCITASGGHTNLYLIKDFGDYEFVSSTLDDAAGECFDKISKFIGLGYPGGPIIEELAREVNFKDFFNYTRGNPNNLNFSFSGIKTAVLYDLVNRGAFDLKNKKLLDDSYALKQKVASSLLVCITDIFIQKLKLAFKKYPHVKAVTFVGGVACNRYIKDRLKVFCESQGKQFFSPDPQFCTDNAAMIAFVGSYKASQNKFSDFELDIF
jgi:N6-L-threonylcarbamoyladenine synthase